MKKLLAAAAALVLAATPAAAQQSAAAQAQPAQQQSAVQPAAPSIWVTRDEIRQRVAANEAALNEAQPGNQNWWWMVAAVAIGVIIAALVL